MPLRWSWRCRWPGAVRSALERRLLRTQAWTRATNRSRSFPRTPSMAHRHLTTRRAAPARALRRSLRTALRACSNGSARTEAIRASNAARPTAAREAHGRASRRRRGAPNRRRPRTVRKSCRPTEPPARRPSPASTPTASVAATAQNGIARSRSRAAVRCARPTSANAVQRGSCATTRAVLARGTCVSAESGLAQASRASECDRNDVSRHWWRCGSSTHSSTEARRHRVEDGAPDDRAVALDAASDVCPALCPETLE